MKECTSHKFFYHKTFYFKIGFKKSKSKIKRKKLIGILILNKKKRLDLRDKEVSIFNKFEFN
jgi:hypothetical protein